MSIIRARMCRAEKIDSGAYIDLNRIFAHIFGKGLQSVSVACDDFFFITVMERTFNKAWGDRLAPHLKPEKFDIIMFQKRHRCECVQTTESFRGKQTLCYTFLVQP